MWECKEGGKGRGLELYNAGNIRLSDELSRVIEILCVNYSSIYHI